MTGLARQGPKAILTMQFCTVSFLRIADVDAQRNWVPLRSWVNGRFDRHCNTYHNGPYQNGHC